MSKYIVITGGQLYNKGAEAMTYLAVDELTKKYPEAKIVVLSTKDFERPEYEKKKYKFEILPRESRVLFPLTTGKLKVRGYLQQLKSLLRKDKSYIKETYRLKKILKNTIMMVDISGFALSSQFNSEHSVNYLSRIFIAENYNIPFYIMPQSFGPFNYDTEIQMNMDKIIKKALSYPKVIYAREKEGYSLLKNNFSLDLNLKYSMDSVLVTNDINLKNIFTEIPVTKKYPEAKGVAIVPNMKTFSHGNKEVILKTYKNVIDNLILKGKTVTIVRHSYEDIEACLMIKDLFNEDDSVVLIGDDMSCIEFDNLVTQFDFIIGSRFHSIVHAYKNAVPSIALGWATKYKELLEEFNQSGYIFDVRKNINQKDIIAKVNYLLDNHEYESTVIAERLNKIQSSNPYNSIT
ncbi:polysaccharide pyruvyl transferase family protein [Alkalibacterium pelagium]|uniref:Colanic acid/amylovoran biosynthesis protein n=1 Tax=Alkalibacterium pelagium TaxID=426702 RepID=A0A1H7NR92_9LACT|nr:polysaccharide pyruvyl transferase family protein [Alkalibacterium pelagium]GEN51410.1 hypothetical protein APE02nite_20750 [Alkalibacterium pelagium]SEL25545.1 colanic acid/amylovoran biosynthesis protein [Alkalibacterium pelagium]